MKEGTILFDRQINKSILKKPFKYQIQITDNLMHISKYVSLASTSTSRKYLKTQTPRKCGTEINQSLPQIETKSNQRNAENILLFKRINSKPLKLTKSNMIKKNLHINHLNSTTQGSINKSDISSQITSRTVTKTNNNISLLPLILDMKSVCSQQTLEIIEDNDIFGKIPEITTATVELTDHTNSNPISPSRRSSISLKKRNSQNISYQEFLNSVRVQKTSKFSSTRIHEINCEKQIEAGIDRRIVNDCIGKKYESITNTKEDKNNFFISKGNFHCPSFYVFGVVEGNGIQGKAMATLVRSNLHTYLTSGSSYGFNRSTLTESEIYHAIIKNNYEAIRFVNDRITEDLIKSKYDIETSGVSVTVLFILGKRLISINIGDIQAVAYIKENEKKREKLRSLLLTSLDVKLIGNDIILTNSLGNKSQLFTGEPTCHSCNITDEYINIVIANKHFWENISYGNCFKFISNIKADDLISKADQIVQYKKKQNQLYNRPDHGFSFVLIEFA